MKISGFFSGVKSEFSKIVWPKKERLVRETVAVSIVSLLLGLLIALLDLVFRYAVQFFLKFKKR